MLTLVKPALEHEQGVLSYKAEFIENGDSIHGASDLGCFEIYDVWLQKLKEYSRRATCPINRVPSIQFLAYDGEKLIGMIVIRYELNDYLYNFGGHIGYSVRKTERCKGYATEMLTLALKECKKMNFQKVLITCKNTNIGSAKTIKNNGGLFENEIPEGDEIIQRYWVNI